MTRRSAASGLLVGVAILVAVVGCGGTATPSPGDPDDFAEVPGMGLTRVDVPRPAGAASAPCDDDPLPPSTDETTAERIAGLRAAGLFADRTGVTDDALAAEVDQKLAALWGDDLAVDDPLRDVAVAEQDASRVLWIDLEADVVGGNEVYVAILEQLEAIALGAFEPTGVTETWAAEEGPITVAFDLGGSHHELRPAYLEDWIDPGILVGINARIEGSGRRFELYRAFDQTALMLALTDPERQALEARGWCFE
jgi:hypothetical protein